MLFTNESKYVPNDNALVENFFSILKTEFIYFVKIRIYKVSRLLIGAYISLCNNERYPTKKADTSKKEMSVCCLNFDVFRLRGIFCTVQTIWGNL